MRYNIRLKDGTVVEDFDLLIPGPGNAEEHFNTRVPAHQIDSIEEVAPSRLE